MSRPRLSVPSRNCPPQGAKPSPTTSVSPKGASTGANSATAMYNRITAMPNCALSGALINSLSKRFMGYPFGCIRRGLLAMDSTSARVLSNT
ncbi:hypothetical protein D3C81_1988080 [compost metagenome]